MSGGGYDNESIAMTAMMMTFWLWAVSLRSESTKWVGVFTGLAYVYMVAAWGGYIFVVNMIGLHAATLTVVNLIRGSDLKKLHCAYSLFYVIGTLY